MENRTENAVAIQNLREAIRANSRLARVGLLVAMGTLALGVVGSGCGSKPNEIASVRQATFGGPTQLIGPFTPDSSTWERTQSAFHFYVVSPGGVGLTANLQVDEYASTTWPQRFLVRHYNPDEALTMWRFVDPTSSNPSWAPDTNALFDGALHPIDLSAAGVHQIRVTFPRLVYSNVSLEIPNAPGVHWGFSAGNGVLSSRRYNGTTFLEPSNGFPQTMYAWAPIHRQAAMRLRAREVYGTGPIAVTDLATGQAVTLTNGAAVQNVLTFAPHPTIDGHVLRFDLPADWMFKMEGFPIILSPTQAAAEAIRASVERLPSGGFVAHKFQLAIAALLPDVLAGVGDRASLHAMGDGNYPFYQPGCVSPTNTDDIYRNAAMLLNYGPLRQIRWALAEYKSCDNTGNACVTGLECGDGNCNGASRGPTQIVDPANHWAGAIGAPLLSRQRCNLAGSTSITQCTNGSACTSGAPAASDTYAEFDGICSAAFNQTTDRWDTLRTMRFDHDPIYGAIAHMALRAGPSLFYGGVASSLVIGATFDHPCNPYGPNVPESSGLFHRGVAASLFDALAITEDDQFLGTGAELSNTPSVTAFSIVQKTLPAFHEAAPHMVSQMPQIVGLAPLGKRVHVLWTEAMRRLVDRFVVDEAWTAANQSAHALLALELFYQGSGLAEYRDLARHFVTRFVTGRQDPAGFFSESGALDATYEGITHWNLGLYAKLTENDPGGVDVAAKTALVRSYDFFNHTVAPEPDESALGGFNFSHRTALGAFAEQWNGAAGIVTDVPEIALWTRPGLRWPDAGTMATRLTSHANYYDVGGDSLTTQGLNTSMEHWRYFSTNLASSSTFPAERGPFARQFDDDLIAVKTESYYATVFVGHPAPNENYWGAVDGGVFHYPVPAESGDKLLASGSPIRPLVGGGLSAFWTKEFGHAVVGTNLSPLMHHGLVATKYDNQVSGRRVWEHYKNNSFTFYPAASTLDVSGEIEETQLTYVRRYGFGQDALHVYITVSANSPLTLPVGETRYVLQGLYENIPVPICNAGKAGCLALPDNRISSKSGGSRVVLPSGLPANGSVLTDKLHVIDYNGHGVTVDFHGRTVRVDVVQDGLRYRYGFSTGQRELRIGQIKIPLKTSWRAGESMTIHYSLRPTSALEFENLK